MRAVAVQPDLVSVNTLIGSFESLGSIYLPQSLRFKPCSREVPDILRLLAGMKVCGCVPSLACSIRSAKDARQKQQGTAPPI